MKLSDFTIGQSFWCGGREWRCTDIGSRVVVGICLEEPLEVIESIRGKQWPRPVPPEELPRWHRGPPYAVVEQVFDENDVQGCAPTEAAWRQEFE